MVNAFSFCLYGPENPIYYAGLIENIHLAAKYFPGWKVYVYYAPDVTNSMVIGLGNFPNVVLRATGELGPINMIHRFYAIDEPEIDLMMVRDADSRIHWKDRWAIREFEKQPQFIAHTIRDNIEHTADMMGGLWGLRKSAGLNMHNEYASYKENTEKGHRNGHDQNFLSDVVYPQVASRILVHYSNGRRKIGEAAVEFPFEWSNDVYCGRVQAVEYKDLPQPPTRFSLPQAVVRIRDPIVASPTPPPVSPSFPRIIQPSTTTALNFLYKK